jgi:hypothetical protein
MLLMLIDADDFAPDGALGPTAADASSVPSPPADSPTSPASDYSSYASEPIPVAPLPGVFEDWPKGHILLDWVTSVS